MVAVAVSNYNMSRLLLCPPDYFSIRYEINPWMNRRIDADHQWAAAQWRQLCQTLVSIGCEIALIQPQPDWPDMVFTANAGLVCGRQLLCGRFRHSERQGETMAFRRWFIEHGFEMRPMPDHLAFEGEGDALWCGDTLYCGHGFRTDRAAHVWLAETLRCPVMSLDLIDPRFYHLDTCFCPLADGIALWHPPAFSPQSQQHLREHIPELIAVPANEALRFACNSVVIRQHILIPADCPQTIGLLSDHGMICHSVPMTEFIKAGGACKCLVLGLTMSLDARS